MTDRLNPDIGDYKTHFSNILKDLNAHIPYANVTSFDAQEITNMRFMFRNDPTQLAEFDKCEKEAFVECYDKIAEQAKGRYSFYVHEFLQEFAAKHNLEIPLKEWQQESKLAYIEDVKESIKNNQGCLSSYVITEVGNLLDTVGLFAVENEVRQFYQEMGAAWGRAIAESVSHPLDPATQTAIRDLKRDMRWEEFGDFIAANVNYGKAATLSQTPDLWVQAFVKEVEEAHKSIKESEYTTGFTAELVNDALHMMLHVPENIIYCHMDPIEFFKECGAQTLFAESCMQNPDSTGGLLGAQFVKAVDEAKEHPVFGQFIAECVELGKNQQSIAFESKNPSFDASTEIAMDCNEQIPGRG